MSNLKYVAQRAVLFLSAMTAYAFFIAEGGKRW